ncbi:MAG: hypothetical protein KKH95_13440 [Gammaproteobacteria bacterium]|nr:hypothetical protein [Gammaproteobacteria bacterium]
MKAKIITLLLLGTGAGLIAALLWLRQVDVLVGENNASPQTEEPAYTPTVVPPLQAPAAPDSASAKNAGNAIHDLDNSELDAWLPRLNSDAIASMQAARINGDPRAPKLSPSRPREMPTAEELSDEEQYLAYEQRQEKRMFRAFVEASKQKTALIQQYIDQAEAGGISEEEVAFAREKIRKIEEMALKLQQEHPDIMQDTFKPEDNWLPAAD